MSLFIVLFLLATISLSACICSSKPVTAVLTFDGATCTYEGPEEISSGDMKITLKNSSEYEADIWIVKLDEGRTWQDILDYVGTPVSDVPPPPRVKNGATKQGIPNEPNAFNYSVDEGSSAIVLCRCNEILAPTQIWPRTAFEVSE
jgi:hypothetical protein